LASLILDNANLVVISDKPEKNPGQGHFAGYSPEFIRRLPAVTLEDTSPSVVVREDGLTEDRFKADDAHDVRNVISFRKKTLFADIFNIMPLHVKLNTARKRSSSRLEEKLDDSVSSI